MLEEVCYQRVTEWDEGISVTIRASKVMIHERQEDSAIHHD